MNDVTNTPNGMTEQPTDGPLQATIVEAASTDLAAPEPAPLVERKRVGLDVAKLTPGDLLQPRSMEELWRVATMFYQSGVYKGRFSSPQQIAAVMMEAAERGIGVATAMKHAYVVNGNVGWSALFVAGQVRHSPKCEYFEINTAESNAKVGVVDYKVRGRPAQQYRLTIDEARAFGDRNPLWNKSPRLMLERRAVMWAARAAFPEVAAGITTDDELYDQIESAPAPEAPSALSPAAEAARAAREALASKALAVAPAPVNQGAGRRARADLTPREPGSDG